MAQVKQIINSVIPTGYGECNLAGVSFIKHVASMYRWGLNGHRYLSSDSIQLTVVMGIDTYYNHHDTSPIHHASTT